MALRFGIEFCDKCGTRRGCQVTPKTRFGRRVPARTATCKTCGHTWPLVPRPFTCPRCGRPSQQLVLCPQCEDEGCVEHCSPGGVGVRCAACEAGRDDPF